MKAKPKRKKPRPELIDVDLVRGEIPLVVVSLLLTSIALRTRALLDPISLSGHKMSEVNRLVVMGPFDDKYRTTNCVCCYTSHLVDKRRRPH